MFDNKSLLITGGTGSFGHHFINILLKRYRPKKVVVFSRDELKQFEMQQLYNDPCMRYFLGDVRDVTRLTQAMRGIDYVIHAAALKQVPAAEYNPMECIKTNIDGAQNVIQASLINEVEKVIALSTDKAVNPVNLYGASKLASDKLFIAANNIAGGHKTVFSVVRYGNVVGSRGSVLPYFKKLLKSGATELPITDPRMTRFWLTLEEGVNFVLKAFQTNHTGCVFIPKIPSIRITDLAKSLSKDIKVKVIGIRPGEKLHEAMFASDDSHLVVEYKDYYLVKPTINVNHEMDYTVNELGERGKPVAEEYEYNSKINPKFLTVEELINLNRLLEGGKKREVSHAVSVSELDCTLSDA